MTREQIDKVKIELDQACRCAYKADTSAEFWSDVIVRDEIEVNSVLARIAKAKFHLAEAEAVILRSL